MSIEEYKRKVEKLFELYCGDFISEEEFKAKVKSLKEQVNEDLKND